MGCGENLEEAFMKSQFAAYQAEIKQGMCSGVLNDKDKEGMIPAAKEFEKGPE
ncbi:MAG: hypothetical protein Ct9H300mP28_14660 [Pseudomonadota bacterium]|nr:MAG: hypothetical protein Ct9H300mP28_14660 [Pseudomonadota bacterium]